MRPLHSTRGTRRSPSPSRPRNRSSTPSEAELDGLSDPPGKRVVADPRDQLASPLLLLDDVTSELDQQRRERLLEAVASFQQTVVTTADEADLGGRAQTVLRVAGGQVTR